MVFKEESRKIIVTGGAGFIGSTLIRKLLEFKEYKILNLDKCGYASDLTSIQAKIKELNIKDINRYKFCKVNLCDKNSLEDIFKSFKPDIVFNLAAETHVDRSIDNPLSFVENNIFGTYNLLESSLKHWRNLNQNKKQTFRLIHISTDEVYGSLDAKKKFNENSSYMPNSPYSASKASSDHLVRAWHKTYDLPTIVTNCSNNFGPWQHPEKLIPMVILKALDKSSIPIYGDGKNIRDWLFVDDHVDALLITALKGEIGTTYCIGGEAEKTNKEVVETICSILNKQVNFEDDYLNLVKFVEDRPGHDRRYAVDCSKIKKQLLWKPKHNFEEGIKKTVTWYLKNKKWCEFIYLKSNYKGERLGLL